MWNIHSREIDAPATAVGALLDTLAGPYDRLWPTPAWWPLRLDKPLAVGASGGHGPVRYAVTEYEPSRRVRFEFTPEDGLYGGFHELRVAPAGAQRCVLTHEIAGALTGAELVTWPLLARPLHDALVEDLLDTAERAVTGTVRQPSGHSRWVRILRRLMADRARPGPLPEGAELARESFVRYDCRLVHRPAPARYASRRRWLGRGDLPRPAVPGAAPDQQRGADRWRRTRAAVSDLRPGRGRAAHPLHDRAMGSPGPVVLRPGPPVPPGVRTHPAHRSSAPGHHHLRWSWDRDARLPVAHGLVGVHYVRDEPP